MSDDIDQARVEIAALVEAGLLTASCPFEGMDQPWTEEEKAGLKAALAEMFNWSESK